MSTRNYGSVTTVEELAEFFDRMFAGQGPIGLDIETGYHGPDMEQYALHPETAFLVGFSFTDSVDWARYVPLAHDVGPNILDQQGVARLLWRLLATGRAVIHNAPFELRHLSSWFRDMLWADPILGHDVRSADGYFPVNSCTQVESYLAAEYQEFGIKFLVEQIFGHKMTELHELFGEDLKKKDRKCLRFNPLDSADAKVIEYACEDALWALALHQHYHPKVSDMLLYRVEMGVLDCVCEMEDFGVRYDWGAMNRAAEDLAAFRDAFTAEIRRTLSELTGEEVTLNLNSHPQLRAMLFGKLGLRTNVYTVGSRNLPPAERKMSTGAIALAGLAKKHPIVLKILQYKEMTRLLGTYLKKYEGKYSYAADGRTHPNHMSAIVVTGRFAVSDPPYQQSPKLYHYDLDEARVAHARHAEAHGDRCYCDDAEFAPPPGSCFRFNFRDCIVAPDGHYILGFDLSQAELRAIAGEAQEPALLKAFSTGVDVHTLTASLMLGMSTDQVTKAQRDVGKTLNFALQYGMAPQGLADRLGIPLDEAESLYHKYFSAFSSIALWNERQVAYGRKMGFVTSRFGRKLPIWEYESDKHWIRSKGDRACVNYPIQGGATGDYVKLAMVRSRKKLRDAGLHDRVHLVMNVHDALEFYVDRSVPPALVISVLQDAVVFPVPGWPPMKAEWHMGVKWGSPTEVELVDGQLVVAGQVVREVTPAVEVDDETGEEIEVLPDVDLAVLAEAARVVSAAPVTPAPVSYAPPGPDARQVIVTLAEMPDEENYRRFLDLLIASPGSNALTLRTPEGDLALDIGTGISPADQATVAMILGDAVVTVDAADVDAEAVVAGLTL